MDKSTRALCAAEDNTAAIEDLRRDVKARTRVTVADGATANGVTSFGTVSAFDGSGVIVAFDGNAVSLIFRGKTVATGGSPLFAVLPPVSGELALSAVRNNSRAFIIGAKT